VGDCGAWALDATTGDLLGILIATCAALSEAYILPAKDIINDIYNITGKEVRLPTDEALGTYRNLLRKYMEPLEWEVMATTRRLGNEHANALTRVTTMALELSIQGLWNEVEL